MQNTYKLMIILAPVLDHTFSLSGPRLGLFSEKTISYCPDLVPSGWVTMPGLCFSMFWQ